MPPSEKVLVLCATGKIGSNSSTALKEAGFDVFGTTRSSKHNFAAKGITPVVCNYTVRKDLDRAFVETGAKKVLAITDYFGAAKEKAELEIQHGKDAIDAAKAAGVEHYIFVSVADADIVNDDIRHYKTKLVIEEYLKASGLRYSILRPTAFFENFDDAKYNPLKKGRLYFVITSRSTWCSTYDIGRAAAIMFKNPGKWQGKTLDVVSWAGELSEIAAALEKVGGVKVKYGQLMPVFLRRIFLPDLHRMFLHFEKYGGNRVDPNEFKKVLPDAFTPEDWFRFYGRYANGESIVPLPGAPPSPPPPTMPTTVVLLAAVGAAAAIAVLFSKRH